MAQTEEFIYDIRIPIVKKYPTILYLKLKLKRIQRSLFYNHLPITYYLGITYYIITLNWTCNVTTLVNK